MNLEQRVYKKLLDVPKGQITTYGELAKAVGLKNGQRVIGKIMNNNPYPVIVPCHRVVMSTGKIGGYAYGEHIKTKMLSEEGVEIKNGKIGRAIKETTISGIAFDVLKTVDMISEEMSWSAGGMCGKKQWIPVGMGGPAIKCKVNIGGR